MAALRILFPPWLVRCYYGRGGTTLIHLRTTCPTNTHTHLDGKLSDVCSRSSWDSNLERWDTHYTSRSRRICKYYIFGLSLHNQVVSQLETSRLQDARVNRTEDDRSVIHLEFDYLNTERRTRDYVMESYEDAVVSGGTRFLFWGSEVFQAQKSFCKSIIHVFLKTGRKTYFEGSVAEWLWLLT